MIDFEDIKPNYHKIFIALVGLIVLLYIGLLAYGYFFCPDVTNGVGFVENTCMSFVEDLQFYIRHVTPAVLGGFLLFLFLEGVFDAFFVPNGLPKRGPVRLIMDLLILMISIVIAYWAVIQIVDFLGSRF